MKWKYMKEDSFEDWIKKDKKLVKGFSLFWKILVNFF
jgi:hypothetical protein